MLIQTFIPEFAIQAFHKGILRRLSWLDKAQCDARFLTPEEHGLAGKFCPIVASNLLGFASLFHQLVQKSGDLPIANLTDYRDTHNSWRIVGSLSRLAMEPLKRKGCHAEAKICSSQS